MSDYLSCDYRSSWYGMVIIVVTITIIMHACTRYRADESGIPYCITVDFASLDDHSVTVRDRDSMVQTRMKIDEVVPYLSKQIDGF